MTGLLGEVDLPAPVSDRWFEDYMPGSVYEFGYASLSQTEIVAFARHYDPQSIHTDPAWSATGPFNGLIASGVHTIAVCMRLYVDHYISRVASLASARATRRPTEHPRHGHRGACLALQT
ncbi:MAG TPA: MaoC/PaaZ C-terminal domain-containing protein [Nocardioidaceae bacterium]|nr:MaoC/PaaZ C-terminal domain-containing protein [Nocardioidaceae bacterium]